MAAECLSEIIQWADNQCTPQDSSALATGRAKDEFFLHLTCVFFMKLSTRGTSSGSWKISQVLESTLTKTVKRKRSQRCTTHLFLWTGRELLGIWTVGKWQKMMLRVLCSNTLKLPLLTLFFRILSRKKAAMRASYFVSFPCLYMFYIFLVE